MGVSTPEREHNEQTTQRQTKSQISVSPRAHFGQYITEHFIGI